MASIFENTVGGPQGTPVTAKATPVDTSKASDINLASNLLTVGAKVAEPIVAARAEAAKGSAIGRFTLEQLKVAEAVEQGSMTTREARTKSRANLATAITNNPQLTEDFRKAHSGIVSSAGAGKIIDEGTEAFKRQLKRVDEASKAGWVVSGMTQEETDVATNAYLQNKRAQETLAEQSNKVALDAKKTGLSKSKIELNKAEAQSKSQRALSDMADAHFKKNMASLRKVTADFRSKVLTGPQAQEAADNIMAEVRATVNSVGIEAGASYIQALVEPLETMVANTKSLYSGEIDATYYENQINATVDRHTMMTLVNDPLYVEAMSQQKVFRNSDIAMDAVLAPRLSDRMKLSVAGEVGNLFSDDPESKEVNKTYFRTLSQNMEKSAAGTLVDAEQTEAELVKHTNTILNSITAFGPTRSDPQTMNQTVAWLGQNSTGKWMMAKGGVPFESSEQAKLVLQQQYEDVIVPAVGIEYRKPVATGGRGKSVNPRGFTSEKAMGNEVIDAVFDGAGIRFMAKDSSDRAAVTRAKELQDKYSKPLNNILRAQSHLSGHMSYEKEFNEFYAPILSTGKREDDSAQAEPSPTPVGGGEEYVSFDPTTGKFSDEG